MAAINDLIEQIEDEGLRQRINEELRRLLKQKKFGLVFEEHQPEGLTEGPVYPYLQKIDQVEHAPGDSLWHTLIESDNYYALQLLAYLYPGMVDCIYIDPPYNTGARDWKYNNDYVDSSDQYRHSKWLSMMKRRLKLAKKLLNPRDSVLIVTIDEKEYLHLGCLLEEMFPEARMQMIATQITPQGNPRVKQFYRTDEYIFFVSFGDAQPASLPLEQDWRTGLGDTPVKNINWVSLLRTGSARKREDRPYMFYPFFIKNTCEGPIIESIGEAYLDDNLDKLEPPVDTTIVWPKGNDGELRRWQVSSSSATDLLNQGFLRLGKWNGENTAVQYLAETNRKNITDGMIPVSGRRYDGSVIVDDNYIPMFVPGSLWRIPSHDATRFGSQLLSKFLGQGRFSFPKSLYAVHDTIRFFVANKPNALIVDFFAGSGTTLNAVNLLNAEDGGHRRCIMVTNNEVSEQEAKTLTKQGYKPGDDEWERVGIARYVNWPRTVCSIEGHDVNGQPLKGEYLGTDHRQMKDGFEANCIFFKLDFLDKTQVALGRQFRELLPLLWMKAGSIGPCPILESDNIPQMMVLPENGFAVLTDEKAFSQFVEQVNSEDGIRMVYLVVDSDSLYREMTHSFPRRQTCQLYRDYLDNFRINPTR